MKLLLMIVVFLVLVLCLVATVYLKNSLYMEYSRNRRHLNKGIVLTASDKDIVISSHNDVRSNVMPTSDGMKKLTWNNELAETAQEYSRNCIYEHSTGIFTSKFKKIGENLYVSSLDMAPKKILKEAIQSWNEEKNDYNLTLNICTNICGHYTQLVWNSTSAVGCGVTTCKNLRVNQALWPLAQLVVCQYGPAGNLNNRRPYQSGAPCSDCPGNTVCQNNLCNNANKQHLNCFALHLCLLLSIATAYSC